MDSKAAPGARPKGVMATTSFSLLLGAAMICIFLYLMVRTSLFIIADYHWTEKGLALALLMAETFTMLHAFGYF
ncbi:MAG: cellulose synthase, partial [Proteobacteria bacterium]|nr:cellulose synthase [Pseudomonadota bacterium]